MKSFFFKAVGIQKFHIHIHMNIVMFTLWCGAEPVISLRFVCICVHIYSWLCSVLSRVWLFATPWTVARQAPLPIGFSRQGYWGGLLFSSPKNLPDPGTEPGSPALQADSLLSPHSQGMQMWGQPLPHLSSTGDTSSANPAPWKQSGSWDCSQRWGASFQWWWSELITHPLLALVFWEL